jgi:hypothetical protein
MIPLNAHLDSGWNFFQTPHLACKIMCDMHAFQIAHRTYISTGYNTDQNTKERLEKDYGKDINYTPSDRE